MNTSKPKHKLYLRTETIKPLQSDELDAVHGGTIVASSGWCIRATAVAVPATIAATRSSQNCAKAAGEQLAKVNTYIKQWVGSSF